MKTVRLLLELSPTVRFLVVSQLAINVGFYMLLPYLASYLANDLGIAAWTVGLILGLRTFSQQGLYLIGGTVSDRLGYKVAIVAGCALRVVGFGLFVVVEALPGLALATFLSGLAGAVFNPAVRAYLAHEAGERRAEAFAVWNVFGEVGALVGPLVGVALLGVEFRLVCVVASLIFLLLTVLQIRLLPARAGLEAESARPILRDWQEVVTNRRFVLFTLGMAVGYYVLFNQLYLGLPLEVRRVTGGDAGMSVLFGLSSMLTIVGQVSLTSFARDRWGPIGSIVRGLALMGLAFLAPLALSPLLPVDGAELPRIGAASSAPATVLGGAVNLSGLILATLVMTVGVMLAQPFALSTVAALSGGRLLGTYYGTYYVALGLGATLGNAVLGLAFDAARAGGPGGLPWALMTLMGLGSAAAILALDRRGAFAETAASLDRRGAR